MERLWFEKPGQLAVPHRYPDVQESNSPHTHFQERPEFLPSP